MARYDLDLLVLGGGAAGLTASGTAAALGMKTMLVERHRLGGDCTWTGCVPSKTILHAADLRAAARDLGRYTAGDAEPPAVDFAAVMEHVRALRREVYHEADAPEVLAPFGVDVVGGEARFLSPHEAEITPADDDRFTGAAPAAPRRVTFRKAVICTGGRAAPPPIEGLDGVDYLTNETLFELTEQPQRLVIVGAGPIGCEMGQAFQRLGTQVTVVDRADGVLSKDDADHAAIVQERLAREGVRFLFSADVERAEPADGGVRLQVSVGGETQTVEGDVLLIATGRKPNTEGLGLDAAGVVATGRGVQVDEGCRTSQKHIWAAGDVTGEYALTHMSEHMGKTAATNAALRLGAKMYRDGFTWTTFTTPEIAQVGQTEAELRDAGRSFVTYRFPYTKVDRAITEDATDGHIKVHATKWRGKILGASVVGERAGELVALYAVAMKGGVTLREISDTIIAYPTYGLGARRAADQYYVQKQFPTAIKAIKRVFGYRGQTPPPPDPNRVV